LTFGKKSSIFSQTEIQKKEKKSEKSSFKDHWLHPAPIARVLVRNRILGLVAFLCAAN